MSDFDCPHCGREYDVYGDDLHDYFDEEGRRVEFDCDECEKVFYVREHLIYDYTTEAK